MTKKFSKQNGFTLVEMLISVSLFVIITFLSLGALLTVFDSNRKSQASKTVVDNLNLTLENMTRNIRFGSYYYAGFSSSNSTWDGTSNTLSVTFKDPATNNEKRIIYRLSGTANDKFIQESDDGGASFTRLTSADTYIEDVQFYVRGAAFTPGEYVQPYVIVMIKGYVGKKPSVKTSFIIQTLISQRKLDF